ncbi:hypothetical protein BT63DRAFT_111269 [Microthyrium microscopicum]|uniref:Uncharacterized protein n=1 Tax=Microthyrium microscopicum TaxID=703497 RepID=A0A6A6TY21_9PEZI|nr:hypothetical protein BT63DRAFT_111269 [Microthyrium microscopicum]
MAKLVYRSNKLSFAPSPPTTDHRENAPSLTPLSFASFSSAMQSQLSSETTSVASPFSNFSFGTTNSMETKLSTPAHIADMSIATPNMDRPKTAGETKSILKNKDWVDSRLAMGSPIEIKADEDVFRFPTPVKRPSTSTTSSPHIGSMKLSSQDSGIGMAIGSPNQPKLYQPSPFYAPSIQSRYAMTPEEIDQTILVTPARAHTTKELRNEEMDGAKPKLSRWKSLGGLFGRKRSLPMTETRSLRQLSPNTEIPIRSTSAAEVSERGMTAVMSSNQSTPASSPGLFRRVTKRKPRVRSPSNREMRPEPPPKDPPGTPKLDISIPESNMERYSVLFKEVSALPNRPALVATRPTRSSSLLARRQASGGGSKPVPGTSITDLDLAPGRLIRRATEPSPRDSPSYRLFPDNTNSPALPHISSLHRPRPVKRNNSAPPALPTPIAHEQKLSPAFEADEMDFDDRDGLTPTPSSPASPSTPKSIPSEPIPDDAKSLARSIRKNSWENTSSQNLSEHSWEMITVGKRLSPGDMLARAAPVTHIASVAATPPVATPDDDTDEWLEEQPKISIARSLSVTKAGARQKLAVKPTRVGSQRKANPNASTEQVVATGVPKAVMVKPVQITVSQPDTSAPIARPGGLRRQVLHRDLTREIWGERELNEQVQSNRAMMPNLCVVEEPENRKSVWGVIESA